MRVFQHVDEFNHGDGIGNDVEGIRKLIHDFGIESRIVCRKSNYDSKDYILNISDPINYRDSDVSILHYGGHGYPLEYFLASRGRKILRFHNITPSCFFENLQAYKSVQLSELKSIFELSSIKTEIEIALCDSEYNKEFLTDLNFQNLKVIPIVKFYEDKIVGGKLPGYKIGFIGRIVPNKKVEDLIFLLHFLKKINPLYSLNLIGKAVPAFSDYFYYVKNTAKELRLEDSISFKENLDDNQLTKEFSDFDFYVSMSEHEGFGIPLLEAFALNIPVLAFQGSAVGETMRGGGVLFNKKRFELIAEYIEMLNKQSDAKMKILSSQNLALKYYNEFPYAKIFGQILNSK